MSSGGIDNRHLFRGITPTHSFPGSVDQAKGGEVGKMEGRGVAKNDSHSLEVPKQKGVDAPKGGRVAELRKGGDDGGMKAQAKLSGVPDRAGMVKFGGRPKDDIKFLGITLHKMSTGYKAILGKLDSYESTMKRAGDGYSKLNIDSHSVECGLEELNRLDTLCDHYLAGDKHGRSDEMLELKHQITDEKKILTKMESDIKGLPGGRLPDGMSLKDAMAYARHGIDLDEAAHLFQGGISPEEAVSEQPKIDSPNVGSFKFDSPKLDSPKVGSPKVDMTKDLGAFGPYGMEGLTEKEAQVLHDHGHGPEVGVLYKQLMVPINEQTVAKDLVDANRKGIPEKLGQGAFNVVYKLEFNREDGTSYTGVFKKEVRDQKAVGWSGYEMGIDLTNPQLGCRNIAARNTNDLLGWDIVPKVEFGIHNGELGIIMGMAPGKTRWTDKTIELTGQEAKDLLKLKQLSDTIGLFMGGDYENQIVNAGRRMGGEIQFDGTGKVFLHKLQNDIDYTNPGVRKGLVQLQWLDGIDAQGDRHGGNYLVNVDDKGNAKVTGIDNDQAEGRKITDANQCKYGPDDRHDGYRSCGWPPIADESMYNDIMGLTEQKIRDSHEGILTKPEIDAKVARMKSAQKHMAKLKVEGKVIKDDAWGSPKATNLLKGKDNYVGRDRGGIV